MINPEIYLEILFRNLKKHLIQFFAKILNGIQMFANTPLNCTSPDSFQVAEKYFT